MLSTALKMVGKGATDINLVTTAIKGLTVENAAAVVATTALSNEEKILALRTRGLTVEEAQLALANVEMSESMNFGTRALVRMKAAATATSNVFKGILATIVAHPIMAALTILGIAATATVSIIKGVKQANDEMMQKASENAETLKDDLKNIDSYKDKIAELQDSLKNDNLSQSEATEKRKELLAIQDELIKKYGSEKDVIDSITAAIKGETDALDGLSKKSANEYLKSEQDAIDKAQEFFQSQEKFYINWTEYGYGSSISPVALKIAREGLQQLNFDTSVSDHSLNPWGDGGIDQFKVYFSGTRDEIIKGYDAFYDYINQYIVDHNEDLSDITKKHLQDLLTNISGARNYILHNEDNSYDTNKNTIETAAKSAVIVDNTYSKLYADYLNKREQYNDAVAEGNQELINQTYKDVITAYDTLANSITYDVGNVQADTIKNWIDSIQQEFQRLANETPLVIDVQADFNAGGLISKIQSVVQDKGLYAEDLSEIFYKGLLPDSELNDSEQQIFNNLQNYLETYNNWAKLNGLAEVNIEQLINVLTQLGIVQKEITDSDFKQSFGLSKDQSKELKAIFSDVDKLNKVYKDLKNGKTVDTNDVAELVANFADLEQYVDWTDEKFGNLAEGIEKVIKERPQDFIKELQEIDTSNMSDEAKRYIQSLIVALQNINVELETTTEFLEHIKKSIKGVSSSISNLIGFSKEIDEHGVLSLSSIDTILADDTYASLRPYINDMENMKTAIASLTSTQKIAYEDLYNEQLRLQNPEAYHKAIEEKEKADDNYFKNSVERIQDEVKNFKNLYGIDAENWEQISTAKQDILQNTNAELLFKQNKLINDFANYYNTDLTNFKNTTQAKAAILDNFRESQVYKQVLDTITADDTKSGITIDKQTGQLITYANPEVRNKINSLLAASGLTYSDYENYMAYGTFTSKGNDALSKRLDELLKTYSISPTNWEDMTKNIKSTGSSTSSKSKNDYIDWIERRLKKLAQTTKEVFSSVSDYISFTGKNNQLSKAIKSIADEISANEKAYQAYMDEANALGLDSTWTWWLQNGGYSVQDISSFSDDLKDKVSRYKELYEKAIDCKNAIADLKKTEKEYAEQMLSNIDKYYDNRINRAKNSVDYYNSLDTDTQFIAKNYGGLADNYNKQISETQNKAKQLQETLNSLVSQGLIKEGSDEWYEWVSKIDQCTIQVRELTKSLHELAVEQFNNIKEQYDNQLKAIEYTSKQYDNKIKKLEEQGYMANLQHYAGLKSVQQQNITLLEKEAKALQKSLEEAIENGDIQKYSKEWYSAKQAIDDVNNSIDEGKIKLIEYGNTMREIEWGYFDYLQDRISQVTNEADFLIDVMSNSKLFDDNGNITAKGKSSIGLHAQNHNVYLAQAQQYATEIKSINKLLADDPNNKKLIERREELLKLQQQSIQATQKEKKAIVDLVKEGIDLQLKSLKKLIDEYKSSLDNAKNLYEYQKKINDKTSDISKIQKQLMAYQGDNSEESRARIQKLQTDLKTAQEDLQETEYEQFISDTKSLLDNLYEDYEESMNKRLENESAIWHEMVGTVNQSKTEINAEIQRSASTVGYTLSKSITDIWSNPNSINRIVVANSTSFNEKLSSINNVLGAINANVSSMVSASGGTFKKYATGGLIDYTGIAQVDGTPTRPELVLNANDTQNFLKFNDEIKRLSTVTRFSGYNFAGLPIPTPHISDISSVFGNIAKSSVSGNGSVNIEHFEIAIDKVQDYNDFVSQLRNDKKVERMIQDMTIGRINGNNSFTKHKYNW